MSNQQKRQVKKRIAKRYLLRHREIFTLSAVAMGVLVVLVLA